MITPTRNEIDDAFKWAVNDIYESDEAWEKDLLYILEDSKTKSEFQSRLKDSSDNLFNAFKEIDDKSYILERVYVYAFMKYYEDTANSKYQDMSGRAQIAASKQSEKYAYFEPELLSIEESVIEAFLEENDNLKLYSLSIKDCFAKKEHTLSEKEEELLAKANQITSVPNEIFSKFNNADVKFGNITDENGDETELTNGKYTRFMQSRDRNVRKNAFHMLYKQYRNYNNTLAAAFYGNVKQAVFYSEVRKYNSSLERCLDGSFIPTNVYTNLIETVNDNLNLMHKYVNIRKKALGVDELHFYDIYAPMVDDYEWTISYEEAKNIAIEALSPLGEEYISKIKEGFNNGWVDVYENKGKRSGAFSWGVYGTHPYVFLNYQDTLDDVFTLVHEMGHAMHTFYSNENQPYVYAGYRIFVAEVASTVNEALLMQYLLKNAKDKKQRAYLLNHFFEQFKGTLYRQTMFAEFELLAHRKVWQKEVLTADTLNNMYKELNEKYFGPSMVIDDEIELEWSRIPHFYTPFYVYQYATGYSAAIAISSKILSGEKDVIEGYNKFLCSGSSKHPIDLLKLCKIDMNEKTVIQDALDVFESILNLWEDLLEEN